ncbi:hypothetical protein ACRAWF_09085 [Streptomyces sp. L7]
MAGDPGALLGRDLTIEPDLSNAQPFLAAALVAGGKVVVPDWPARTTQPGDRLREIFTEMGGSSANSPSTGWSSPVRVRSTVSMWTWARSAN